MTGLYRLLGVSALAALLAAGSGRADATSPMSIGFNWTPGVAPAGETPQSALARIGGSVYRDYNSPWSGDTDRARIRLVRYGMQFQRPNALPGSTYQISNEPNLQEQDAILRYQTGAVPFAQWYKAIRDQIKAYDPQALIVGPGMWNWNGAGSGCCTTGQQAYQWFVDAHQSLYGMPPQMDFIAVHIYPWSPMYWDDPQTAVAVGLAQIDGAQAWSTGRWPVVVTEHGMLRKPFWTCTVNPNQTEQERYAYTREMLEGAALRGTPLMLFYGSHEQAPCDGNGWMSWLINADGSLTVEGQAHRGTVPAPPPPPTATAPRVSTPPATPTMPPEASTATRTAPPFPTATFPLPASPTPTLVPAATPTPTFIVSGGGPCKPGRRCPPTPMR